MFQTVVVPLDGSPLAANALDYAMRIVDPTAHLMLVAVVDIPVDEDFRASHERAIEEMITHSQEALAHDLEERAEPLRERGFRVTTTVRTGDATDEILRCAADARADLIAMAPRGTSGIAHWLMGSVTNRVLHTATTPLLVVHTQGFDRQPTTDSIVVTLDGSRLAETSLPVAEALATRLGLPVRLVRVVRSQSVISHTTLLTDITMLQELVTYERAVAERYLKTVINRFTATAVDASATVLIGNPAEELVDYLALRPHALIVMTTAGAGGVPGRIFGSITEKVVTVTENPALILR
jgi:nucleotide-binding universal stress UspA family protein